jgi:hypothetical protein
MNKAFNSKTRKRRDPLEKLGVDEREIFKWMVKRYCKWASTRVIWLKTGKGGRDKNTVTRLHILLRKLGFVELLSNYEMKDSAPSS